MYTWLDWWKSHHSFSWFGIQENSWALPSYLFRTLFSCMIQNPYKVFISRSKNDITNIYLHYQDIIIYMLCKHGGINFAFKKTIFNKKTTKFFIKLLELVLNHTKSLQVWKQNICVGSTNLGSYSTYASSSMKPFKNALLTSIWTSLKSLKRQMEASSVWLQAVLRV